MNNCEECGQPYKTLYRVKYELFHLRWIHICFNCGKLNRMIYGDQMIFVAMQTIHLASLTLKKEYSNQKKIHQKNIS